MLRLPAHSLRKLSAKGRASLPSVFISNQVSRHAGRHPCRHFSGFSMDALKEIRARSGAPIVECKKALQNCDNKLEESLDWLREHGSAKALSKVEGRETTEGLVSFKVCGNAGSIVKVSAETDFAARSGKFVNLLLDVADATLHSSANGRLSSEESLASKSDGKLVKDLLDEAIVAIRENLSVVDSFRLTSIDGTIVGYVHNKVDGSNAGSAASIVELIPSDGSNASPEEIKSIGKKLAMHVVAAHPQYLTPADIPEEVIEKEREIHMKQLEESGKPPDIMSKIVDGKLRKFYEGICLTEQSHMIEDKSPKVSKVLSQHGLELKNFVLLSI